MISIGSIVGEIGLQDKFSNPLARFTSQLGTVGKVAGVAAASVAAFTGAVIYLGNRGAEVQGVADAFDQLASAAGVGATGALEALQEGTLGTISAFDLMKTANRALSAGFKGTEDDLKTVGQAAVLFANRFGEDTTQAYDMLMRAMGSGRLMMLRQYDLQVDMTGAIERYRIATGKLTGELTQSERTMALRKEMMEKLRGELEKSGVPTRDFGNAIKNLWISFVDIRDEFAKVVASSPVVLQAITGVADIFGEFTAEIGKNKEAFGTLVNVGVKALVYGLAFAGTTITGTLQLFELVVDTLSFVGEGFLKAGAAVLSYAADASYAMGASEETSKKLDDMAQAARSFSETWATGTARVASATETAKNVVAGLTLKTWDLAGSLRIGAEQLAETGKKAGGLKTSLGGAGDAAGVLSLDIIKLHDSLLGMPDMKKYQETITALENIGDVGMVSQEAVEDLAKSFLAVKATGKTLPPIALDIIRRWERMKEVNEVLVITEKRTKELKEAMSLLGPTVGEARDSFEKLQLGVEGFGGTEKLSTKQLQNYLDQLNQLRGMNVPGIYQAIGQAQAILTERGERLPEDVARHQKAIENLQKVLGVTSTIVGQVGDAMEKAGIQGAAAWAQLAQSATTFTAAIASGDIASTITSGFTLGYSLAEQLFGEGDEDIIKGAAAGMGLAASDAFWAQFQRGDDLWAAYYMNVLEALKSQGQSASSLAGEELGKVFAEAWRYGAEGLQQIQDVMSALGDELARGVSGSLETFSQSIDLVFQQIRTGQMSSVTGAGLLGQAFVDLGQAAENGIAGARKEMLALIRQTREAGLEVPEITQAVQAALSQAASGVQGLVGQRVKDEFGKFKIEGGIPVLTQADATSQATIFSATFWGIVKEVGPLEAAQAMKPAWESLQTSLAGFDAEAILGPMQGIMDLVSNEATAGIVGGIQSLQQALNGLADAGYMTESSFSAMQQQAQSAFSQLVAAGAAPADAMQAIAPLLGDLQKAAEMYGFTLDANTQALLGQAAATGVAFPTEPMEKMVDILTIIAEQLGATIPESMNTTANAFATGADKMSSSITASMDETSASISATMAQVQQAGGLLASVGGPGVSIPGMVDIPHFGAGGIVTEPTLAVVGEVPERITPLGYEGSGVGAATVQSMLHTQSQQLVLAFRDALLQVK